MRFALAALILVGFTLPAVSQVTTPASLITMIRTGLDSESFAIVTQGPILNPEGCPTPDGYVADSSRPGYNTYYAAALAAYVSRIPVRVTIPVMVTQPTLSQGLAHVPPIFFQPCEQGRPRLIGIEIDLIR
jgi:hypothetical protein